MTNLKMLFPEGKTSSRLISWPSIPITGSSTGLVIWLKSSPKDSNMSSTMLDWSFSIWHMSSTLTELSLGGTSGVIDGVGVSCTKAGGSVPTSWKLGLPGDVSTSTKLSMPGTSLPTSTKSSKLRAPPFEFKSLGSKKVLGALVSM